MKKIIIVLFFVPFLTGCASILYRTNNDPKPIQPGIYPSVRADVENVNMLMKKDYDSLLHGAEPMIFILSLADIPVALTFDTILLPYDLYEGISNTRKLRILLNKYFPDYKIVRNPDADKNLGQAHFYLVSSAGEKIDIWSSKTSEEDARYSIYPKLNDILNQKNISISTKDDVAEIMQLITMLMHGTVITGYWEFQAVHSDNLWIVKITGSKNGGGQLGHTWELKVDSNNYLREISSRW